MHEPNRLSTWKSTEILDKEVTESGKVDPSPNTNLKIPKGERLSTLSPPTWTPSSPNSSSHSFSKLQDRSQPKAGNSLPGMSLMGHLDLMGRCPLCCAAG
ncbi:hypothetical protein Y1Q_0022371 [Alligator mississippiensis]|uniref:Uncharacterized protein n=1 Tax=Alligator mississippiensis TaxID=8496 RepID=A0A151PFX7_ALLMI|nr:hypothetical protein Y1Q_0022371 [Alligator mississippiensis]